MSHPRNFQPSLILIFIFSVLFVAGCSLRDTSDERPDQPILTVWSECLDLNQVISAMPLMERFQLGLVFCNSWSAITTNDLVQLVQSASKHDIPLSIAPMLDEENGYYLSAKNAEIIASMWDEILQDLAPFGDRLERVILSMGTDPVKMDTVSCYLGEEDYENLFDFLLNDYNASVFYDAELLFQDMILKAQLSGFRVGVAVDSMTLEDYVADTNPVTVGNKTIQKLFDIPIQALTPDGFVFRVERTKWSALWSECLQPNRDEFSPYLVFSYGFTAKAHLPETSELMVGRIDDGSIEQLGFDDADDFVDDLEASLGAGFAWQDLHFTNLLGLTLLDEPEEWITRFFIGENIPHADERTLQVRLILQTIAQGVVVN